MRSEGLNTSGADRYVDTASSRLLAVDGSSGLAGRFAFVSEPAGDVMAAARARESTQGGEHQQ